MSDSLRPMRPIQRHPFVEEVLPVSGGPTGHHPAHPKPPTKPCSKGGLHREARVKAYVHGFKQLQKQWPTLSPDQRRQHVQALANAQLRASGSPALTFLEYKPPPGTAGELDFSHWTMKISDSYMGATGPQAHQLSDWDAKVLAAAVYHESRHSEQWYMAARKRAADLQAAGGLTPQQQAQKMAQEMVIPLPIAQEAQKHPMPKNSPLAPCAQQVYDSIYGTHKAARDATLTHFHQEYVDLDNAQKQAAAAQAKLAADQNAGHPSPALLQHDAALLQQAQAHQANVQHQADLAKAAYQALPEEADAYATGHQVEKAWDGKLLQY